MRFLRTNTAVIITVGPFYDKTDGVTIETALTITNEKITLTADTDAGSAPTNILDNVTGATSGTANDLNYITGNDAGMMQLELAAADTNRLGRMFLSITDAANHVPVFHEFMVLPAMIYDAFVLGTDVLDASVTQWLGTAASTPTVAGVPNVNAKTWNDLTTVALPLVPTTAGRTLDVSATGEAGVDWANVGAPTTTLALTGTTIATTQKVDVETIKTNPVVNAGTITFPTTATLASTTNITAGTITTATNVTNVNGIAANVITATSIAADAITAAKVADGTIDAATFAANSITAASTAADFIAEILAQVNAGLDAAIPGTPTAGSINDVIKDLDARLPGSGTLSILTAAAVNAEVVDALNVDTYAEPGQGVPAATTTIAAKINYLYKAWRNKKDNDGTNTILYADDGLTADQKQATSSSGGTVTKAEWISGA